MLPIGTFPQLAPTPFGSLGSPATGPNLSPALLRLSGLPQNDSFSLLQQQLQVSLFLLGMLRLLSELLQSQGGGSSGGGQALAGNAGGAGGAGGAVSGPGPVGGGGGGGTSGSSAVSSMPQVNTPPTQGAGGFTNPIDGKLTVSSEFGPRSSPTTGAPDNHSGIDIPKPTGTPIRAAKGGVVSVSRSDSGGYGNWVEIKHDDGTSTRYAHMSERGVSQGARVEQGQVIGKVGSTGNSTGPHLHFEYRDSQGRAQNPRAILNL